MEARSCARCGKPFVAVRPNAKYCGSSCRGMATKARSAGAVVQLPAVKPPPAAVVRGCVESAVRVELEEAGRADSALGVMALELARTIDDPMTPPGVKAALTKQCQASLVDALRVVTRSRVADLRGERDRLRAV